MAAGINVSEFLKEYSEALRNGDAALFVGAGVSRAAGFVDWKRLLNEIAADLGLDIDKETDLVALAQYHKNYRKGRNRLNQLIINEFLEDVVLTDSLRHIATLPVHAVWTTNYDQLLENAFEGAHKRIDVKRKNEDFATSRRRADVAIYKMHGDVTSPDTAVITKEDYESYNSTREVFTVALKGDLTRKTFLFLGFSFSDPNIAYILSRVQQLLEHNARDHFCILKRPQPAVDGDYTCTRFNHWLDDLHRYHIQPVLIDDYAELPALLAELNRRSHLRDIFISGSAQAYERMDKPAFDELCRLLGEELIRNKFNIMSGFGLGVGSMVIIGAMGVLKRNDDERLQLWPFPQEVPAGMSKEEVWAAYRERMLAEAGVCVVLAGNKIDSSTKNVVLANGVQQEVDIARSHNRVIIPIGATGYVAEKLWNAAQKNPKDFFGSLDVSADMATLGSDLASPNELVAAVIRILKQLDSKGQ